MNHIDYGSELWLTTNDGDLSFGSQFKKNRIELFRFSSVMAPVTWCDGGTRP
jgi:hypothetical protein